MDTSNVKAAVLARDRDLREQRSARRKKNTQKQHAQLDMSDAGSSVPCVLPNSDRMEMDNSDVEVPALTLNKDLGEQRLARKRKNTQEQRAQIDMSDTGPSVPCVLPNSDRMEMDNSDAEAAALTLNKDLRKQLSSLKRKYTQERRAKVEISDTGPPKLSPSSLPPKSDSATHKIGRPYRPEELRLLLDQLVLSHQVEVTSCRETFHEIWRSIKLDETISYVRGNLQQIFLHFVLGMTLLIFLAFTLLVILHMSSALAFGTRVLRLSWRTLKLWSWLDGGLDTVFERPIVIGKFLGDKLWQVMDQVADFGLQSANLTAGIWYSSLTLLNSSGHQLSALLARGAATRLWESPAFVSPNISEHIVHSLQLFPEAAKEVFNVNDAPELLVEARSAIIDLLELAQRLEDPLAREDISDKGQAFITSERRARKCFRSLLHQHEVSMSVIVLWSSGTVRDLAWIGESQSDSGSYFSYFFNTDYRAESIADTLRIFVQIVLECLREVKELAIRCDVDLQALEKNLSAVTAATIKQEVHTNKQIMAVGRSWIDRFSPEKQDIRKNFVDQLALILRMLEGPRKARKNLNFAVQNFEAIEGQFEKMEQYLTVHSKSVFEYLSKETNERLIHSIELGVAGLKDLEDQAQALNNRRLEANTRRLEETDRVKKFW